MKATLEKSYPDVGNLISRTESSESHNSGAQFNWILKTLLNVELRFLLSCTGLLKRSDTWVGWTWILLFHSRPSFAWANGNLAEVAGQQGKMSEQTDQSQPNNICI